MPGLSSASSVAYEARGTFAEADQCYRAALAIDPDNKDCAEALTAIQKKLALKQNVDAQQSQSRTLAANAAKAYQSGETLSALDLYKQLDEKAPNQALVEWNIGTIYLLLKNPTSALEYCKAASKLKPEEQRYADAVKQLQQNLKRKEMQENLAAQEYSQTQPNRPIGPPTAMQPGRSCPPNQTSVLSPTSQGKAPEPLFFYGVSENVPKRGARITSITSGSRGPRWASFRSVILSKLSTAMLSPAVVTSTRS